MSPQERIEEAHGLWELAICRLAALAEAGRTREGLKDAIEKERQAFEHWRRISVEATEGR